MHEGTTAPPAETKNLWTPTLDSVLAGLHDMQRATDDKRVIQRKNEEIKVEFVMENKRAEKNMRAETERRMSLRKRLDWCGGGEMGAADAKTRDTGREQKTEKGKGNDRRLKPSFEWD